MESSKTRRYVSEGTMIRVFLKLLYQDGMLDNDTYVIAQKLLKEMYPILSKQNDNLWTHHHQQVYFVQCRKY